MSSSELNCQSLRRNRHVPRRLGATSTLISAKVDDEYVARVDFVVIGGLGCAGIIDSAGGAYIRRRMAISESNVVDQPR